MLWARAGKRREAGMYSSALPGKPLPAEARAESVRVSTPQRQRRRRGKEEIEALLSKKVQVGAISRLFEP